MARVVLLPLLTQPPFGTVYWQVLNEEYTRCMKTTQIPAAFPSSLHRSVPAHCLPSRGLFSCAVLDLRFVVTDILIRSSSSDSSRADQLSTSFRVVNAASETVYDSGGGAPTGTGIGLSVARDPARLHHGDVRLMDAPQGCWFRVELGACAMTTDVPSGHTM